MYYAVCFGGTACTDLLYEKGKDPDSGVTLVLMIVTITYKLVLVVIGVVVTFFGQGFIHKYLYDVRYVFYLGTGLNVFCVVTMLILVFHPVLARTILVKGMALLERMHLMKRKQSRLDRLNASMDQYRETAVYLKNHVKVLVNVFGITLFQRFALFTAIWIVRSECVADYSASVNHLGFSGYVATSGRNGNQRKAVPGYLCTNLWNGAASSGNDFKQRTWILYRAACKCSTYDRG